MKSISKNLLCLFFCTVLTYGYGQKENNFWFFGTGLGLDFNDIPVSGPGGTPEVIPFRVSTFTSTASRIVTYSSEEGDLLFYSGGSSVLNRNHEPMLNGEKLLELGGGIVITDAIAAPAGCGSYYLFYQGRINGQSGSLVYSVIDMELDGGLGGIPQGRKDKVIYSAPLRSMAVVAGLGSNWLVGVSKNDSASIKFHAFKLSPKGISDPITSIIPIDDLRGLTYTISFSPSGKHLMFNQQGLLFNKLPLHIMAFDKQTGVVEKRRKILPEDPPWSGYHSNIVASQLSQNENLLYTVERYAYCEQLVCYTGFGMYQYQFDPVEFKARESTKTLLAFYDTTEKPVGDMKLSPKGKIYLSRYDTPFLDVIHKPNLPGRQCDYRQEDIQFSSGKTSIRLPHQVIPSSDFQFINNEDLVAPFSICDGQPVVMQIEECYDSIIWSDYSRGFTNSYLEPGEYWVRVYSGTCSYQQDFEIIDYKFSNSLLPPDTVLCNSEVLTLDVNGEAWEEVFNWEDGTTDKIRTISDEGEYFIEIDDEGCLNRDSIKVQHFSLPESVVPDDTLKCAQENVTFSVAIFQANYDWSDGSISPLFRNDEEGLYKVTVSIDRCTVEDSVFIRNRENIDFGFPEVVTVCKGEEVPLDAYHPRLKSWEWSDSSTSSLLNAVDDGIIILKAKDNYCSFRDTVEIIHELCIEPELYLPNIFTPNNDGNHDVYEIGIPAGLIFNSGSMQVYDRYGNKVAYIEDIREGWDGRKNGKPLAAGVYVGYITVNVEAKNGVEDLTFIANITLLK